MYSSICTSFSYCFLCQQKEQVEEVKDRVELLKLVVASSNKRLAESEWSLDIIVYNDILKIAQ